MDGTCSKCGERPKVLASPGSGRKYRCGYCRECERKYQRAYQRVRNARNRADGLCHCGRERECVAGFHYRQCKGCRESNRRCWAAPAMREKRKAWLRENSRRHLAAGKCRCGRERAEGRRQCAPCLESHRLSAARAKARRAKAEAKAKAKARRRSGRGGPRRTCAGEGRRPG